MANGSETRRNAATTNTTRVTNATDSRKQGGRAHVGEPAAQRPTPNAYSCTRSGSWLLAAGRRRTRVRRRESVVALTRTHAPEGQNFNEIKSHPFASSRRIRIWSPQLLAVGQPNPDANDDQPKNAAATAASRLALRIRLALFGSKLVEDVESGSVVGHSAPRSGVE